MIDLVLVGCGAIGALVARGVYAGADRPARVVGVVDTSAARRDALAAELGCAAHESLARALDVDDSIAAVDIRVPHDAHAAVAREAMQRGRHVLIEKPVATSLADADALIAQARRRRVVAAVAENYPHLRAVRATADAIRSGELGELRALRTTRAYTLSGIWIGDGWRRTGDAAGILLDQGTHHTSLLRRLGGEIESVSAAAGRRADPADPADPADDHAETVLVTSRFTSGLVAQSLYTWGATPLDDEAEGTVFGSHGRIDIRVSYDGALGRAVRLGPTGGDATALSPPENYYESHRAIVEDWVARIGDGGRPRVTLADGRGDLAVVLAAARSLRERGREVTVEPLEAVA